MFSRTDKTVDIFPQTRANVGYVSNYECGYVPLTIGVENAVLIAIKATRNMLKP